MDCKALEMIVLRDIAEKTGVSIDEVRKDFNNFNEEIDHLMEEEGLSNNDALNKVIADWHFKFLEVE